MLHGVGSGNGQNQAVDTQLSTGGASTSGGLLSGQKDAKDSPAQQFGDIWKKIQNQYGAKPEKQREVKKTLGKDDFLRIMITQMKNQDPTSPFKAEQFATEMAQFTSVEQLKNLNDSMAKMTTANQPLERLAMTNMIGKLVTVDRDRFPHVEGSTETLNFNLPKDASQVHVTIISELGETVFDKELGAMKAGEQTLNWDGLKSNTLPAKQGNYMLRVAAQDENGTAMPTNSKGQVRVVGVSFEGNEPSFLVGNPGHPDKVSLRQIIKIDDAGPAIPGAVPYGAPAPQPAAPNFIAFRKGEGSSGANPDVMSPEARAALERYAQEQLHAPIGGQGQGQPAAAQFPAGGVGDPIAQARAAQARSQAMAEYEAKQKGEPVKAEGFPNGLQDNDEISNNPANLSKGGESK